MTHICTNSQNATLRSRCHRAAAMMWWWWRKTLQMCYWRRSAQNLSVAASSTWIKATCLTIAPAWTAAYTKMAFCRTAHSVTRTAHWSLELCVVRTFHKTSWCLDSVSFSLVVLYYYVTQLQHYYCIKGWVIWWGSNVKSFWLHLCTTGSVKSANWGSGWVLSCLSTNFGSL